MSILEKFSEDEIQNALVKHVRRDSYYTLNKNTNAVKKVLNELAISPAEIQKNVDAYRTLSDMVYNYSMELDNKA